MRILGIETTCDETSAAVLENGRTILSNIVFSQVRLHKRFHGVVPELASRAHMEKIAPVMEEALRRAGAGRAGIDAVAFARGPGLPGALLVGRMAAETASRLFNVRLVGVNHLEGHLLACELADQAPLKFPLVALIVSGGHTELWIVKGYGRYRALGRTRDDAAGEAFDKVSKLLGLGYPGGQAVERAAAAGDASAVKFPRPYLPGSWDFSFSGLKTAVAYYLRDSRAGARADSGAFAADICASFQEAVTDTLAVKAVQAALAFGIPDIAVGGGVAANSRLRVKLSEKAAENKIRLRFVEKRYCMDNAAMIALAGYRKIKGGAGKTSIAIDPELKIKSWAR